MAYQRVSTLYCAIESYSVYFLICCHNQFGDEKYHQIANIFPLIELDGESAIFLLLTAAMAAINVVNPSCCVVLLLTFQKIQFISKLFHFLWRNPSHV